LPTVSVGSTDLHSVGQLYLGGPARTLTTFVYCDADHISFTVPKDRLFPKLAAVVSGKSINQIMSAIRNGTMAAYNKQGLPFMEIQLKTVSAYEIGAFMQFKMIEMMYLGRLFCVDAFNQPAVELYKAETKSLLSDELA
jgi:glucose-6-phosphate isomerase